MEIINFSTVLARNGLNPSSVLAICEKEGIKIVKRVPRGKRGFSTWVSKADSDEYLKSVYAYRATRPSSLKQAPKSPFGETIDSLIADVKQLQETVKRIVEAQSANSHS